MAQIAVLSEKTKRQQPKGKIVLALVHTFWHFSTLSHFLREFFRYLPPGFLLELRGFTTVLAQRDEKIIKNKKQKNTKPFCTLVVARLSSSNTNDHRDNFRETRVCHEKWDVAQVGLQGSNASGGHTSLYGSHVGCIVLPK